MSDSVAARRSNVVNTLKTVANFLYQHLIDSTAILMAVTPIYMFLELVIWRFDPLVSFRARRIIVIITYLGTGFLIAKGRDLSKRTFGVDQPNTSERRIVMHDLFFLVEFILRDCRHEHIGQQFELGFGVCFSHPPVVDGAIDAGVCVVGTSHLVEVDRDFGPVSLGRTFEHHVFEEM